MQTVTRFVIILAALALGLVPSLALAQELDLQADDDSGLSITPLSQPDYADQKTPSSDEANPITPDHCLPSRMWTTDSWGHYRTSFHRGETMSIWVDVYNYSPYSGYARFTLISEKRQLCILPYPFPCPASRQTIVDSGVYLYPGVNRVRVTVQVSPYAEPGQRTLIAMVDGSTLAHDIEIR